MKFIFINKTIFLTKKWFIILLTMNPFFTVVKCNFINVKVFVQLFTLFFMIFFYLTLLNLTFSNSFILCKS